MTPSSLNPTRVVYGWTGDNHTASPFEDLRLRVGLEKLRRTQYSLLGKNRL